MLRTVLVRFRWLFLGASAAALIITTTSALAGSGVGGVFNLGQLNTVDAQTALSGNPGSNPQLKLTNTGTNAGIRVDSVTGIGVNGVSQSGTGQQGQSQSGIGLLGIHAGSTGLNAGVEGRTASSDASGAGVLGRNTGGGPGVRAVVNAGAPPLAVNSSVKVTSLNADLLDGLDSSALQKRVSGTCSAGQAIRVVAADGSVTCEPVSLSGAWSLSGNAGTTPGSNFLGTTDNQALELKVNGQRALRLEPETDFDGFPSPNVIGGYPGNSVSAGVYGATIAGGGQSGNANSVTSTFGTVGGGSNNTASGGDSAVSGGFGNTASGNSSFVAGGNNNTAGGLASFAAGTQATAAHQGSFVWNDDSAFALSSNSPNSVSFGATGGARFVTGWDSFTGNPNAGVTLAPGGGSWGALSDRASKRGFTRVDRTQLLRRLDRIPISSWSYKAQQPSIRHLGPMAQDFRSAFGLGEDRKHIDTIDSEGVALAAIQGLYRQNQIQQEKVARLQRANASLQSQLDAQGAQLTRLERALARLAAPDSRRRR